jgi:hypothetical protein
MRRMRDELTAHAWHVAAFSRQERLPDLKSVLSRETRAAQTPAQQWDFFVALAAKQGVGVISHG